MSTIRAKDRDAVIQSLRAGVVPRVGQHLILIFLPESRQVEIIKTEAGRFDANLIVDQLFFFIHLQDNNMLF